jgi:hypothetical protein
MPTLPLVNAQQSMTLQPNSQMMSGKEVQTGAALAQLGEGIANFAGQVYQTDERNRLEEERRQEELKRAKDQWNAKIVKLQSATGTLNYKEESLGVVTDYDLNGTYANANEYADRLKKIQEQSVVIDDPFEQQEFDLNRNYFINTELIKLDALKRKKELQHGFVQSDRAYLLQKDLYLLGDPNAKDESVLR